jgi:TFIIF-interacting CTD phosphatase-like protein
MKPCSQSAEDSLQPSQAPNLLLYCCAEHATAGVVRHVLCRSACVAFRRGIIVKELSLLRRPLDAVVLVDNAAMCASLQPDNAIIVSSFLGDATDNELAR